MTTKSTIPPILREADVERMALDQFRQLGYEVAYGPAIEPDSASPERASMADVVLAERLRASMERLNPSIPPDALAYAMRQVLQTSTPSLAANNHTFHRLLTEGIDVTFRREDGAEATEKVWLLDFAEPVRNDWFAVNQFTVVEKPHERRPDILVFVNGLPLAIIELKNPADKQASMLKAYNQLQTYKEEIPSLLAYNEVCVVSDGSVARVGTVTADWERFMPWRSIDGTDLMPPTVVEDIEDPDAILAFDDEDEEANGAGYSPASGEDNTLGDDTDVPSFVMYPDIKLELETVIKGVFEPYHFLDLVRNFITFERQGGEGAATLKKMAAYHQFFAVNKAIERTVRALPPIGDKRIGIVWHTQGSGKSLSMVFYAAKLARDQALSNPTIVVITDRNDLDDQLFGTFSASSELLRQDPVQAADKEDLGAQLDRGSGGIVFTTIQKFPDAQKDGLAQPFSSRSNIIVIVDEAHRSHYDFDEGYARNLREALPNASFIAFTGTPIETDDKSTPRVFGAYIDIYDITQAVEDKATVPIYYEARLAKLDLDKGEQPHIDLDFEEVTEGEELEQKEYLKNKWSRIEAIAGTDKRIAELAQDIVDHFEQRMAVLEGKGIIVCMSREICAKLYNAIVALRPEWHGEGHDEGEIKVVITGSAEDERILRPHVRSKTQRERLARRFKNPKDPFKLVIVRDMWLTGFDAPSLHTMYVDKPMRGHTLMQSIARVNRVFKDKPGGLVVDYIGLAEFLKQALAEYTGGKLGQVAGGGINTDEVADLVQEKVEILRQMLKGFDYSRGLTGTKNERQALANTIANYILGPQQELKTRFLRETDALTRAFALSVPNDHALEFRDEVAFFQLVGITVKKTTGGVRRSGKVQVDSAVRQIVNNAIAPAGLVDIFAAAGLRSPDISIFSEDFLEGLQNLPEQNLALQALRKLIQDEIKDRLQRNVVQKRSFETLLNEALNRYHNRSLEAGQVILELIDVAKKLRAETGRGQKMGLSEAELAFYDALAQSESAREVLGDDTLKDIAQELVKRIRENVAIDWAMKEGARAKLRVLVKRLLRKYDYPPDKRESATDTVLDQAKVWSKEWVLQ